MSLNVSFEDYNRICNLLNECSAQRSALESKFDELKSECEFLRGKVSALAIKLRHEVETHKEEFNRGFAEGAKAPRAIVPIVYEKDAMLCLMNTIRYDNHKWWTSLETGERIDRNVGEMLALVHSEISEALEGHRKGLMDDHLPQYRMFTVELADAIIRILDIAANIAPELPEALMDKLEYNRRREDHKPEHRKTANGKKY
jgi:NTP pyrophosphatase (non-canonical NTP hydrolase)